MQAKRPEDKDILGRRSDNGRRVTASPAGVHFLGISTRQPTCDVP
jgi:hypothetical protein